MAHRDEKLADRGYRLLAAICRAQETALTDSASPGRVFEAMLAEVLDISGSAFGFMGEIFYTSEGMPFLKTHALTNIAWNKETQALYEQHLAQGLEFHNLDNLLGAVLKIGEPVIANDPGHDPRRGTLPAGHPPLDAFLGLPVRRGDKLVGMIGLANRPGGYDQDLVEFLLPLIATCGTLIHAFRLEQERRRSEKELTAREQRFQQALVEVERERSRADAVLASIGDSLTMQDTDFRILYQNAANKKIFGDRRGEYCYQAYHGKTAVCEGCAVLQSFRDGMVHRVEKSVVAADRARHFEITASPLKDASGQVVAGIEIAREITDYKEKEELLAEQVRLLSLGADIGAELTKARTVREMLAGCCGLLVIHLDAAFARIWTVNSAGDMLELRASAGMYTHVDGPHGRIPVDNRSKIGSIASNMVPHATNSVIGDPQVSNQDWARQEGMVAFAGHPLLVGGRLVGVVGMFFRHRLSEVASRAIASIADEVALGIERLQSEERLRRSNRALRILSRCNEALVHAVSEPELLEKICGIIVGSDGYRMAWVGYAVADAEKTVRPVAQAGFEEGYLETIQVRWDDSERGQGPTGTAIRTGQPGLMRDIRADSGFALWRAEAVKRGYSSVVALPLIDSSAKPFGSINIYSSEPDAFDEEEIGLLGELAGDLSYGIMTMRLREERQQGLQEKRELQAQLRQAQKLEAIGTLAGGIAHDFNNILSAILGYAELLRDEVGGQGQARDDLEEVIRAGKRAADLVRQILVFSRRSEKKYQPVRIQYIVKEAIKLLRPSLPVSIEIRQNIDPACPEIMTDPGEIHQVLMNLVTNAYHAMRQNGGVLDIRLESVAAGPPAGLAGRIGPAGASAPLVGPWVRLTVRDTGCGMEAATVEKIFDPYFTTKPQGEGTGLGLALVYGIVSSIGGEIVVNSEAGQGSTFEIYFPAIKSGERQDGEGRGQEPAALPRGSERIMVVDDETPIVQLLDRMLTGLGYRVTVFTSSGEALRSFTAQPDHFDLVITDLTMPRMPGTDLARKIIELRPDIPVILCTGFSETVDQGRAKAIGIRELLYKPVDIVVLAGLVRRILDGDAEKGRREGFFA